MIIGVDPGAPGKAHLCCEVFGKAKKVHVMNVYDALVHEQKGFLIPSAAIHSIRQQVRAINKDRHRRRRTRKLTKRKNRAKQRWH